MKKANLFVVSVLAMVLCQVVLAGDVSGQDLPPGILEPPDPDPDLREVYVQVVVDDDPGTEIRTYYYRLVNGAGNRGALLILTLDVGSTEQGLELPLAGRTLTNGDRVLSDLSQGPLAEVRLHPPLALATPPPGWWVGINIVSQVGWGTGWDWSLLHPGDSLGDFVIESTGVPGIRNFSTRPDYKMTRWSKDFVPPADDTPYLPYLKTSTTFTFHGTTIGPTAPPIGKEFNPVKFLEWLRGQKDEAFKLGWIDNRGIKNSLNKKLDAMIAAGRRGQIHTAANIIEAFIHEVEAQRGKHTSDEAYYLLKLNAEFLKREAGMRPGKSGGHRP